MSSRLRRLSSESPRCSRSTHPPSRDTLLSDWLSAVARSRRMTAVYLNSCLCQMTSKAKPWQALLGMFAADCWTLSMSAVWPSSGSGSLIWATRWKPQKPDTHGSNSLRLLLESHISSNRWIKRSWAESQSSTGWCISQKVADWQRCRASRDPWSSFECISWLEVELLRALTCPMLQHRTQVCRSVSSQHSS